MPLFNIFKNKSKDKRAETQKINPKIIADIHEKNSLVLANLAESKDIELEIKPLEVGDYLADNTIVERKSMQDFASSIISKRLIVQLENMLQYPKRLLIIEGKLKDSGININENALRGMMLSVSLDKNIPIIQTKNEEETAKFLILLAKRELKPKTEFTLHSRKPESKEDQIQYIIESFPNIGPQTAKALLKKFKTIKNIINASKEDLEAEIGKKAESIVDLRD